MHLKSTTVARLALILNLPNRGGTMNTSCSGVFCRTQPHSSGGGANWSGEAWKRAISSGGPTWATASPSHFRASPGQMPIKATIARAAPPARGRAALIRERGTTTNQRVIPEKRKTLNISR